MMITTGFCKGQNHEFRKANAHEKGLLEPEQGQSKGKLLLESRLLQAVWCHWQLAGLLLCF